MKKYKVILAVLVLALISIFVTLPVSAALDSCTVFLSFRYDETTVIYRNMFDMLTLTGDPDPTWSDVTPGMDTEFYSANNCGFGCDDQDFVVFMYDYDTETNTFKRVFHILYQGVLCGISDAIVGGSVYDLSYIISSEDCEHIYSFVPVSESETIESDSCIYCGAEKDMPSVIYLYDLEGNTITIPCSGNYPWNYIVGNAGVEGLTVSSVDTCVYYNGYPLQDQKGSPVYGSSTPLTYESFSAVDKEIFVLNLNGFARLSVWKGNTWKIASEYTPGFSFDSSYVHYAAGLITYVDELNDDAIGAPFPSDVIDDDLIYYRGSATLNEMRLHPNGISSFFISLKFPSNFTWQDVVNRDPTNFIITGGQVIYGTECMAYRVINPGTGENVSLDSLAASSD